MNEIENIFHESKEENIDCNGPDNDFTNVIFKGGTIPLKTPTMLVMLKYAYHFLHG